MSDTKLYHLVHGDTEDGTPICMCGIALAESGAYCEVQGREAIEVEQDKLATVGWTTTIVEGPCPVADALDVTRDVSHEPGCEGEDECGGSFECSECGQLVGYCLGGDPGDTCNDCWSRLNKDDDEKTSDVPVNGSTPSPAPEG